MKILRVGWFLVAALLAAAACSGRSTKLSISSRAAGASPSVGSTATSSSDIVVGEVTIVVREVELEGSPACSTHATSAGIAIADGSDEGEGEGDEADGEDDGECDLKLGPFAVVMNAAQIASGAVTVQFDAAVPSGAYEELEVVVDTISAEQAGSDSVLQAMAAAHASVKIVGTIAGQPFTFTAPVAFEAEREPFTVPAAGTNVTVEFDSSAWFVDGFGHVLDPRDPANATASAQNIRASFRAYGDDDRDGHDDETEHD